MRELSKLNPYEKGAGYMFLSAFGGSLFVLFSKLGLVTIPTTYLVAIRFIVPLILITPFLFYFKTFKNFPTNLSLHIVRAVFVVISQFCLFYYLTKDTMLNANMLWNTSPLYIPIIARVIFKQRVHRATWLSVVIGLIGVVFIIKPDSTILFEKHSIWGILSGFTVAVSQVIYGHNREKSSLGSNLFYFFGLSSILSILIVLFFDGVLEGTFTPNIEQVFFRGYKPYLFFFLIAFGTILNQLLRGKAYQYANAAYLAPFIYLSVFISGVLDYFIFGNLPDRYFLIGSILIVGAAVLRIVMKDKQTY